MEIGREREWLLGCLIKLIVRCRLEIQTREHCPLKSKQLPNVGFKFSDSIQIPKVGELADSGEIGRLESKNAASLRRSGCGI